ncbi:hypothetical protein DTL42_04295 [Bremerella cremea]|uniref:Uncharacterized protein n=1 Tax=Bremerella cremea TaxID=1031537 RepID=A0A368KVB6_9BACT|nr:DUF6666 family protein [Bremerella cremea]RCS54373.1 hypothetical protein DTL42_04295 [Bremerella cremea]
MRVFPWIFVLLTASCVSSFADLATAAEPREPAKLTHVVSEDYTQPPSPQRAIRSLFSNNQDRVYAARQRVARASYVASKVQAGDVQPVDYSVLSNAAGEQYMEGEIVEGTIIEGDVMMPGHATAGIYEQGMHVDGGCTSCQGGGCESCETCGDSCNTWCVPICFSLSLEDLSVRAGVEGFKGPLNRGVDGSFGFLYGINWGTPFFGKSSGLGFQLGINGSSTNMHEASFTDKSRNQFFMTAGLFRRVDWGWQGGVVLDYMSDDWYYSLTSSQIRGELSWKFQSRNEFGFWFTASDHVSTVNALITPQGSSTPLTISQNYQPNNMFAFFYRTPLDICGGEMRFSGGWTEDRMGLLSADMNIPVTQCLAVETNFLYLIPRDSNNRPTPYVDETWNVGFNLVWYPRACSAASAGKSYYRPLFNTATNGTFSMYPTN